MRRRISPLVSWFPAALLMLVIFLLSGRPATELPSFGWADLLVKKGGHVLGYALLGITYWHGFEWKRGRAVTAWLMAVAYAATDEFHQSFSLGRHPSALDVILFDGPGAALGLWLANLRRSKSD